MATINKLEDLLVWQKSRVLVKQVFNFTSKEPFSKEFFLKDQIKRSAISIMSNISEGFGRGGNKEFVQFLYIANGSLNELKAQIYIALDFNLITETILQEAFALLTSIELMIKSLAKKLKESEFKGAKFAY
ncbi:MAG TPA: four helix bundle protein [Bacteroidia bacterium]|jgi:four helix bundle protein|nr:four helix bundle protein [Bacteroidia bacterium]